MKGEPFVKLPRDLLESTAWRSLTIHARRLIDFLMIEHMRQGGKRNGLLLAPTRQLVGFGIHPAFVAAAVEEVERVGLVDCKRGLGRSPNVYGLTWLPLNPSNPPTDRWRHHEDTASEVMAARKLAKTRKRPPVVPTKVKALQMPTLCSENAFQSVGTKPVKPPQSVGITVPTKVKAPSRSRRSYHGEAEQGADGGSGERLPNGAAGAPRPSSQRPDPLVSPTRPGHGR